MGMASSSSAETADLSCIGGVRMAVGGPPGLTSGRPFRVSCPMEECLVTVDTDTAYPPRLAPGIELLGELKDSGFAEPRSLLRRADGQVIQLPRLLYLVSSLTDGTRRADDIASAASAELGRELTGEQVRYLIAAKLAPLGVVAGQDAPAPPPAPPPLALRARVTLLPERAACAAGTFLRPLFHVPVVAAVIVSVAALDFWI